MGHPHDHHDDQFGLTGQPHLYSTYADYAHADDAAGDDDAAGSRW